MSLTLLGACALVTTLVVPGNATPNDGAAKSGPPDKTHETRKATHQDLAPLGSGAVDPVPGAFLRDPIVSNTNTGLNATEDAGDGEPSIAVNPTNPNEIVIAAFSDFNDLGGGGFWHSLDGGNTWTFQNTYVQPTSNGTVPNDQQLEFTNGGLLAVTFLAGSGNIVSGSTANPANQASWNWSNDATGNTESVNTTATSAGNSDQPWIVTGPRPGNLTQDNIYNAYDDFGIASGVGMQVNSVQSADPPNFNNDVNVGNSSLCCQTNPGLRLASDRRTGFVYAVWQNTTGPNGDNSVNSTISLNRTTDGGANWGLNGSATGITVATGASNQRTPKFGTVNALIGGVHHAAVDPVTGDVYVVYACGDGVGGDNPLCIVRVHDDGSGTGTVVVDPPNTITTLHSALPSVAVANNGVIGVEFTSFDGFSIDGFPIYTAHFSMSDDQGATWVDQELETSLSPVTDNSNARQRVLGDYQELVAIGRTFYGTFTGNGVPFGRPFANMDPIFFKVFAGGPQIAVTGDLEFGTVARGTTATRDVIVQNVGTDPLVVNGIGFMAGSDAAFSIVPTPSVPATIEPSDSVTFQVRFSPPASSGPGTRTGTLQIQSNDPDTPTATLQTSGKVGVPKAALGADDLQFGGVPVDDRTSPNSSSIFLQVANEASCDLCDLTVTGTSITGTDASDFSVVGDPAPETVAAGDHLDLTISFNPSGSGTRTAMLHVATDDPVVGTLDAALTGTGLLSDIGVTPEPIIFRPTVFDPRCGTLCGRSITATVRNTGQAELIVDDIAFSNAMYSGPEETIPRFRVAVNDSYLQPVTFHPVSGPDRSVDGTLSIQHNVAGSSIQVQEVVPLCGESVGRGIRVLVVDREGTIYPSVRRITLQSFGVKRKILVDVRNAPLTTIVPPQSCRRIRFHFEDQNLPVADRVGQKSSYYVLKAVQGNGSTTVTFTLGINEFKTIVLTVG